jgi:hypothetical protein
VPPFWEEVRIFQHVFAAQNVTRRSDLSPEQLALSEELCIDRMVRFSCFAANCWQMQFENGGEFIPPLFRMPGVELPIVPRIGLPRIDEAPRKRA